MNPNNDKYRTYMREYMRRYRQAEVTATAKLCLHCGKAPIPPNRAFYCSTRCQRRAVNANWRRRHPGLTAQYAREFRAKSPEIAAEARRRWQKNNPNYYRDNCPECGGLKNRTAKRCDTCRARLEAPCKDNEHCGVKGRHKHCQCCGEPVRHRFAELCAFCEAERNRMGVSVAQFRQSGADEAA